MADCFGVSRLAVFGIEAGSKKLRFGHSTNVWPKKVLAVFGLALAFGLVVCNLVALHLMLFRRRCAVSSDQACLRQDEATRVSPNSKRSAP